MIRPALVTLLLISAVGCARIPSGEPGVVPVTEIDLFKGGEGGYAVYRIPSLVKTNSGAILAFAEARRAGRSDHGDIDVVMRKSTDGGKTWGAVKTVWDDGDETCGNPSPVVDAKTGRVVLLSCWNKGSDVEKKIMDGTSSDSRRAFVLTSDDEGETWSTARDITKSVKKPDWRWYAIGPCHGIQLPSGRLVMPANHSEHGDAEHFYRSHIIFSDDSGATWSLGGTVGPKTNESTIAALPNGTLVMNMRSYEDLNRRAISTSADNGMTWSKIELDQDLIEPRCQASLLAIKWHGKPYYLFSNPASTKRNTMTVKWSNDEMHTWNPGLLVNPGFSAYSDMVQVSDSKLALAYERDEYARISLLTANLSDLLGAPQTTTGAAAATAKPDPAKPKKEK